MVRKFLLLFIAALMTLQLQAAQPDSARVKPAQWIVPGAMVAVGATFVALPQPRHWMAKEIGTHNIGSADDYIRIAPLAAYELLGLAGVKSQCPFVDRVIKGATAAVIMGAVTYGTKYCIHEERPDGSNRHSFPSGHAAAAFMGAELLRQDYGPWIGAGGYVVATAVGVMRLMGGHHWVNDVVAGAGIGILSAQAARWLLPLERQWLGLNQRRGESAIIVPGYAPGCGAVTLTAAISF